MSEDGNGDTATCTKHGTKFYEKDGCRHCNAIAATVPGHRHPPVMPSIPRPAITVTKLSDEEAAPYLKQIAEHLPPDKPLPTTKDIVEFRKLIMDIPLPKTMKEIIEWQRAYEKAVNPLIEAGPIEADEMPECNCGNNMATGDHGVACNITIHRKKEAALQTLVNSEPGLKAIGEAFRNVEDYNKCYGCGGTDYVIKDGREICANCETPKFIGFPDMDAEKDFPDSVRIAKGIPPHMVTEVPTPVDKSLPRPTDLHLWAESEDCNDGHNPCRYFARYILQLEATNSPEDKP